VRTRLLIEANDEFNKTKKTSKVKINSQSIAEYEQNFHNVIITLLPQTFSSSSDEIPFKKPITIKKKESSTKIIYKSSEDRKQSISTRKVKHFKNTILKAFQGATNEDTKSKTKQTKQKNTTTVTDSCRKSFDYLTNLGEGLKTICKFEIKKNLNRYNPDMREEINKILKQMQGINKRSQSTSMECDQLRFNRPLKEDFDLEKFDLRTNTKTKTAAQKAPTSYFTFEEKRESLEGRKSINTYNNAPRFENDFTIEMRRCSIKSRDSTNSFCFDSFMINSRGKKNSSFHINLMSCHKRSMNSIKRLSRHSSSLIESPASDYH